MDIEKIDASKGLDNKLKKILVDFLHSFLDRFRDPKDQIQSCLDYAMTPGKGGFIYLARNNNELSGAVVILNTCMRGFIPPYFLVYIAVNEKTRGQGIGGKLIEYVQSDLGEDICLHVEHDNPAKKLYERAGFSSKYLEMRWQK